MSELREIIRPEPPDSCTLADSPCPYCTGPLFRGQIACPEGRLGCLVIHYGLLCRKCGKEFE